MKRKTAIFSVAVLVLLLCLLCGCTNYTAENRNRKINSINHRGYGDAPENTLAAFRLSKQKGFDAVECDVSFTKDGVPVLLHDATVNRTSNGRGKIRNLTFDEVRALDFGSWKGKNYAGEKIPTFFEFLALCCELELYPYIEIKGGASVAEIDLLTSAVLEAGICCTWIARDVNALKQTAKVFPEGRFGLLVDCVTPSNISQVLQLKTDKNSVFLDCSFRLITQQQVESCKAAGVPLELWTMDNASAVANIHPYVSGVTSNFVNAEELFKTI